MTPFDGTQSVEDWFENFVKDANIEKLSVDQAFNRGLADNVMEILRSMEERLGEEWEWTLTSLQVALLGIEEEMPKSVAPKKELLTKIAIGSACVAGAALLAPVAIVGGLGLIGFSAVGPVAGSIAAGIQSVVYGGTVASGSAFAIAQSIAMGGAALTAVEAGAAGVGLAAAGGAAMAGATAATTGTPWPSDFVVSDQLLEEIRDS